MSLEPDTDDLPAGMVECRVCRVPVPEGEYCGLCGLPLKDHEAKGPDWLRLKAYSASPGEHLLRPNIVSTLFPHLSPSSRMPFLLGLGVLLAALIAATPVPSARRHHHRCRTWASAAVPHLPAGVRRLRRRPDRYLGGDRRTGHRPRRRMGAADGGDDRAAVRRRARRSASPDPASSATVSAYPSEACC